MSLLMHVLGHLQANWWQCSGLLPCSTWRVNTLRPRQNGRHFPDDIFYKCIFLNENVWISIKISSKFVPSGQVNIPSLIQIMTWRRPGDRPLSELMMIISLTHISVTRPEWVNIWTGQPRFSTHMDNPLQAQDNWLWQYHNIYIFQIG